MAKRAQNEYETTLVEFREGSPLSKEFSFEMDAALSFAVRSGQSMLRLYSGSLSPLGFDGVQRPGCIAFHPCGNTVTVLFDQQLFRSGRAVPGHEPIFI